MNISVTLTANAGVALEIGGRRIWVDALHEQKMPGFSSVSLEIRQKMAHLGAPEFLCFTHNHPDHYSARLTQAALNRWSDCVCLIPQESWGREHCVEAGVLTLRFVRLPHEGAQYADVRHYGLIVTYYGRNILIAGDCAVASEALAEVDIPIHFLILPFPWITLPRGRAFLEKYFPGVPAAVCHLPFREDDCNGYRAAAERAVYPGAQLLAEPLQTLVWEV